MFTASLQELCGLRQYYYSLSRCQRFEFRYDLNEFYRECNRKLCLAASSKSEFTILPGAIGAYNLPERQINHSSNKSDDEEEEAAR